jgi:hypothetical protein
MLDNASLSWIDIQFIDNNTNPFVVSLMTSKGWTSFKNFGVMGEQINQL